MTKYPHLLQEKKNIDSTVCTLTEHQSSCFKQLPNDLGLREYLHSIYLRPSFCALSYIPAGSADKQPLHFEHKVKDHYTFSLSKVFIPKSLCTALLHVKTVPFVHILPKFGGTRLE